jgi:cyclophilin family peptidyl-prolyl cis-trans isomerase
LKSGVLLHITPAERNPIMRILRSIVAVGLLVVALSSVHAQEAKKKSYDSAPPMTIDVNKQYTATLETSKGKIVLELLAKEAPKSVNNFVFLSREKFYDGTIFHRVIPGFMIQGGDPEGSGRGGPGYRFENENKDTKRTYQPGTVGMANAGPDTNGSQFFIMDAANPLPPNQYTIFGQLKEGQDVVRAVATVARDANDRPREPVVLKSVTIEEK